MDKTFLILLIALLVLFGLYLPINTAHPQVYSFKTRVDDLIPLWTPFVAVYISYFGFLLFSFSYFVKLKFFKEGKVVMLGIIISCVIAYLFYGFFQNSVDRPVIENHNIFDWIYSWLNSRVAPYNAFPSLHVAISTVCALGFYRIRSKVFKPVLVWAFLIIISTVLTKQHYFLDVISGLSLGFISFWVSQGLLLSRACPSADAKGRITP